MGALQTDVVVTTPDIFFEKLYLFFYFFFYLFFYLSLSPSYVVFPCFSPSR